jgi:hypothetical protein
MDIVRLIGFLLFFGVLGSLIILAIGSLIDIRVTRSARRLQFLASGATGWLFVVGAVAVYLIVSLVVLAMYEVGITYESVLQTSVIGLVALAGFAWVLVETSWGESLTGRNALTHREFAIVMGCLRLAADQLSDSDARRKVGFSVLQLRADLRTWEEFGEPPRRSRAALAALTSIAWVLSEGDPHHLASTEDSSFSEDEVELVFERWKSVQGVS